jgi:hypothetical protein
MAARASSSPSDPDDRSGSGFQGPRWRARTSDKPFVKCKRSAILVIARHAQVRRGLSQGSGVNMIFDAAVIGACFRIARLINIKIDCSRASV